MHNYAQTNIQLFNQLRAAEYSHEDLVAVRRAYDLTQELLPGRFRPRGKPLHDHLIGTASILATLKAPRKLIIAGLLHAIYAHGDFGVAASWRFASQRQRIQSTLDAETEALIAA